MGLFGNDGIARPCRGHVLELPENQNLTYVRQLLSEHRVFGPQPIVVSPYPLKMVHDEPEPVVQFPVLNPKLVDLVP